jgi:hypothetical protein
MIFSLFKKNNEYIEKEMDDFIENEVKKKKIN